MPVMDELKEVNSFVFLLQEENTIIIKHDVLNNDQFKKRMIIVDWINEIFLGNYVLQKSAFSYQLSAIRRNFLQGTILLKADS